MSDMTQTPDPAASRSDGSASDPSEPVPAVPDYGTPSSAPAPVPGPAEQPVSAVPTAGASTVYEPPSSGVTATAGSPRAAGPGVGGWHGSLIGGLRLTGRWTVPSELTFVAAVGGVRLDLREAAFETPQVTVTVVSAVGGVRLIVPQDVDVVVRGFRLIGSRRAAAASGPTGRTVVVRSFGLVGGVRVTRG